MMQIIQAAQEYVNLMAVAFQVLASVSELKNYLLYASKKCAEIHEYVKEKFDKAKAQDTETLLKTACELLDEMMAESAENRCSYAAAICLCMDQMICYVNTQESSLSILDNRKVNLHSLVSIQKSDRQPVIIDKALNSNQPETGIVIFPKFPVSGASMPEDKDRSTRSLSTRNSLYGINGKLNNVLYYPFEKDMPTVRNIILPERHSQNDGECLPEATRIVFSPLSDRQDFLSLSNPVDKMIHDIPYNGVAVDCISDPEYIEQRFADAWLSSCQYGADIFFAPEMLATDKMVCVENNGSTFLRPLLKEAAIRGHTAPRLTIMPTYWKNGENSLWIFDETGEHLGTQFKQVPYVDEKNNCAEALITPPNKEVLMIHLINQQRIAFVICAEFLVMPQFVRSFLCEKLGATLILVPSYSRGEQDFVDTLPVLKPYGTSVIWGNCCGAPGKNGEMSKRIIGCGSFAGIDPPVRFGEKALCNFQCNECKVCFFRVDIPTNIHWSKPESPPAPNIYHTYI